MDDLLARTRSLGKCILPVSQERPKKLRSPSTPEEMTPKTDNGDRLFLTRGARHRSGLVFDHHSLWTLQRRGPLRCSFQRTITRQVTNYRRRRTPFEKTGWLQFFGGSFLQQVPEFKQL